MLNQYLSQQIIKNLPFEPTQNQHDLIDKIADFLIDRTDNKLFLLKGFAGTGKTSVISALVQVFKQNEQPIILMAPTGRAANVLSVYSKHPASTIHRTIFRQKPPQIGGHFELGFNKIQNALFIVDEASMIAENGDDNFGSGSLLDDLLQYVYNGVSNCRLLIMGDTAQLPPIMYDQSPALEAYSYIKRSFEVDEFILTDVVRQKTESGILSNATALRNCIDAPHNIKLKYFNDVVKIDGTNFLETLEDSYRNVGIENTIIITRSNKKANMYCQGIRGRVLWREEMLSNSDLIMVVKNNYLWGEEYQLPLIANGDIAEIVRTRGSENLFGKQFTNATLYFSDLDKEIELKILIDSLSAENPAQLQQISKELFTEVEQDYIDIKNKSERYKQMRKDPYLNALQIKFGYAVTCHKAQGGQWQHVYIDMGPIQKQDADISLVRWLYTALTRATEKVYLINFSQEFF